MSNCHIFFVLMFYKIQLPIKKKHEYLYVTEYSFDELVGVFAEG